MVRDENLDFWIKHGYNVLFIGEHGVGKTSIVRSAFERNGLNWKYFSAATMDPWVDLVGVPRERQGDDGEPFLDLVRCQGLDDVEAFFFDELNRSHKKIRNAVMELIQFRTINGKPFKNLKAIWAAINPDDDETYDVEKLDPAQADRFHIKVTVPYKPDKEYFASRYGNDVASSALSWWYELPENLKKEVSPRRLDYALDIHQKNGDVRFALPEASNVTKLLLTIKHGPVQEALQKFMSERNVKAATEFISKENNYQSAIDYIKKSNPMMSFFFPLLSAERLSVLASEKATRSFILNHITEHKCYSDCINNIYQAGTDKESVREIIKKSRESADVARAIGRNGTKFVGGKWPIGIEPEPFYFPKISRTTSEPYATTIRKMADIVCNVRNNSNQYIQTSHRKKMYEEVLNVIPKNISVEEAVDTLRFIDGIAQRSQFSTILGLRNLMGLINYCTSRIADQTGWSLERIVVEHGKQFSKIWDMILSDRNTSMRLKHIPPRKIAS